MSHYYNQNVLQVEKWFGTRKELAAVRTVCSHVQNMMKGVTLVRNFFFFTPVNSRYNIVRCFSR